MQRKSLEISLFSLYAPLNYKFISGFLGCHCGWLVSNRYHDKRNGVFFNTQASCDVSNTSEWEGFIAITRGVFGRWFAVSRTSPQSLTRNESIAILRHLLLRHKPRRVPDDPKTEMAIFALNIVDPPTFNLFVCSLSSRNFPLGKYPRSKSDCG